MSSALLTCRNCSAALRNMVLDLGVMPLANSYIKTENSHKFETAYPLQVYICDRCWLMQTLNQAIITPEYIFSNYAYYSSFSKTWRSHCAAYAQKIITRLALNNKSQVVEVGSNDGALLESFKEASIPVIGVDPAENIVTYANQKGLLSIALFFGEKTAVKLKDQGFAADLIVANNVLAHVPDLHDFIAGFATLLKPTGTITFEFPSLQEMLRHTQFDTVYHEHFSYLSLTALIPLFERHNLRVVDVEYLPTHGGSLRIFVMHADAKVPMSIALQKALRQEEIFGLKNIETYNRFSQQVNTVKAQLLEALRQLRSEGKRIAAYGAPAKGNTLLNACGIGTDLVAYTVDRNPEKQGCLLPGSHLPVYTPEFLFQDKPDVVLILPWNIADEIIQQMAEVRQWGGKFLICIPTVRFL